MHTLAFFGAAAIAAGLYYLSIKIWPYKPCPRCSGGGRNAGSTWKRFGMCGRCGGTGRCERLGTRLFLRK